MLRIGVFRHRWFTAFVGAVGVLSLGGEFAQLALPLLVLDATHSVGAVATLRVVGFLPYIVWGPFAGALIDRLDRRKVMLACDAGALVSYSLMALLVTTGFSLLGLYALAFLASAFEATWALVTDFSVIPALVEEAELTHANAAYLGVDRAVRAFGPALAGVTIASLGIPAALLITAASSLATIGIIVVMPPRYRLEERPGPLTPRGLVGEIGAGFGFVLGHPILRALLVLMFVANLGGAGIQTVLLYQLREQLGLPAGTIGLALSAAGVAALVGSVAAPRLARGRPLGHTMLGMVVGAALGTGLATFAAEWRLVVAGVAGRMFAQAAHIVYAFLPRQREIPAALRGRANAAFRMLLIVANAASPPLLGAIVDRLGTAFAYGVASLLMLLAAGITYFSPLRAYDPAGIDAEPPAAAEEAEAAE